MNDPETPQSAGETSPPSDITMHRLNANQARRVEATFAHVDSLLRQIEQLARDERSAFANERPDLAPDEARLLLALAADIRSQMLVALDRLGAQRPEPRLSARWTAHTDLQYADVALSELTEGAMRGYGAVDSEAAATLATLAHELRDALKRGVNILHEHDPGGLLDRVAAIRGPEGEVLRALERLTSEQGLAQLRPLIAAAAERAESSTFDTGVFGRVGAGKSSLINALIGAPVLPVGATPVTAVPIRISHGPAAAVVRRQDGTTEHITLARLQSYVSEEENPSNRLGVRSVDLTLPSIPVGLRLLDTPGVGSLASTGSAQAFAYLPRCDLGLVLVAAGNALTHEEVALVSGLIQAGIDCRVLVSKSDLLSPADLERSLAYVRRELAQMVPGAQSIEVAAVSAESNHLAELHRLRDEVIAPLAADHSRAARVALGHRLRRLVAAAEAALAGAPGEHASSDGATQLTRARQAARETVRREADRLAHGAHRLVNESAIAVAAAWNEGRDPVTALRRILVMAPAHSLSAIRQALDSARGVGAPAVADGDARRMPPLFDPELLDSLPTLPPPVVAKRMLGRHRARRRLAPVEAPLSFALTRYAARLYAWGMAMVDESASWDDAQASAPTGAASNGRLAELHALVDQVAG